MTRAEPRSARARPARTLIRVVLPAPLGPSNPKNSPWRISRSIPESACCSPKRLWTSRTSIAAGMPVSRLRERSARSRLKQLGDSVEFGEILHGSGQIGEAQSAPALCGPSQPLQGKGYRGGIDLGHVAEVDHSRALPQVLLRSPHQPRYGIQRHRTFENERVALSTDHVLPAFARSGWRFFVPSDLIRPSTPCSRTLPAKVSR